MLKRVLVATDFEDGLGRLGLCLNQFAASGVEAMGFVHALPWAESGKGGLSRSPDKELAAANAQLSHYTQRSTSSLKAELFARVGDPAEVIRQIVQEFQPDVLVLGMPSRSLLAEKVFGSTTIGLLPQLKVPVLILRPQLIATLTLAELDLRCRTLFRYLILPCDLEAGTPVLVKRVLKFLGNDATDGQVMHLLHVLDSNARHNSESNRESLQAQAQEKLDEIALTIRPQQASLEVITEVRYGAPVKEILLAAQETDVTAIATSSRNIGRIWEWTVPSVTGDILRRSWHSILFFPPLMES